MTISITSAWFRTPPKKPENQNAVNKIVPPAEAPNYDAMDKGEHVMLLNRERPQVSTQHIAALAATLSALASGAVFAWTSPILTNIQKGEFHDIAVSETQMGWIGSFVALGAMTACLPGGLICEMIGPKMSLLFTFIPFSLGWSLIIFARTIEMLYGGRFITGMACGVCCVAAPIYCHEIASDEIRGTLGTYFQLMMTIGILVAYISGKFLPPIQYTILCGCLPLLFFTAFIFQPESPVYVIRKGFHERALQSLKQLRGKKHDNRAELIEMQDKLEERNAPPSDPNDTLRTTACRNAFICVCALMFFQQFSGICAVILYSSDIFAHAGGAKFDPNTAAIIVATVQVLATFSSSLGVEGSERKILLMSSGVFMGTSSMILALYISLTSRLSITLTGFDFLPLITICAFVSAFSLGLGPIPWMISSELFTSDVKSVASSVAGTLNWFLAFTITKFYLQINNIIGQDITFFIFGLCGFIGALFVNKYLPETKDSSIEMVQAELAAM